MGTSGKIYANAVAKYNEGKLLDAEKLRSVPRRSPIIDIASAPGGVDREYAARLGLRTVHALSLPGKYAPRTAAEIICEALIPLLTRDGSRQTSPV